MRNPPIIIFAGDTTWKVARGDLLLEVPASAGATAAQIAREISTLIGSSQASATLAIPSAWCLSATVSLEGIPARNRRSALLYRLELLLPLTAEDIATDYIFKEPTSALAICVSTAALKEFVDAIEEAGILVQSIVPASIYAVHALDDQSPAPDAIIWQSGDTIEIFAVWNRIITGWYLLPAGIEDLRWHLEQLFPDRSVVRNITCCSLSPATDAFLRTVPSLKLLSPNDRSIEQSVISASAAGKSSPVEFRRDGLAPGNALRAVRRPVIEAVIAAFLLIICICGAACWRANRLEQLAARYRVEQQQAFREVFPGHAVPANIVSRLKSEERKLQSGDADTGSSLPQSTLPTLQTILLAVESLSPETRLEVEDLKVEDNKVLLDGIVRNRADLTAVEDALQQIAHLQLDAPQTEQQAGKGLHLSLTGTGTGEPTRK